MKKYNNLKLVWKLIILVLVTGTIPMYVVTLTTHFTDKSMLMTQINDKNAFYAQTLASKIESFAAESGKLNLTADSDLLTEMKKEISSNQEAIGKTAVAYIVTQGGLLVNNATSGALSSGHIADKIDNPAVNDIIKVINTNTTSYSYTGTYKNQDGVEVLSSAAIITVSGIKYGLVVEIESSDSLSEINRNNTQFTILLTFVAIFAFAIATYVSFLISKPLNMIIVSVNKIANADLTDHVEPALLDRKDEVGNLGNAVENVTNNLKALLSTIHEKASDLNTASEKLNDSSRQASRTAEDISNSVVEIAQTATSQAQNTEQGVNELKNLDGIIAEESEAIYSVDKAMTSVKNNVSDGLYVVNKLSEKNKKSLDSSTVVQNAVKSTNECARKISKASTFIASIAEETNMLSLNASIEAARAGEAGRGFAVVASEIQKLAIASTEATQNIDSIIEEIIKSVEIAVTKTEESVDMLSEQTEIVESTAEKFRQIADEASGLENAISLMTDSGQKVKKTSGDVMDVIRQLSMMAEQNAATTEEVSASVEEQGAMVEEIEATSEILLQIAQTLEGEIAKFTI